MDFNDLSPELREKAKSCTSTEELFALAKGAGYKLSDQEMEAVSGGQWIGCSSVITCDTRAEPGDVREGVDPALAPADFVNGAVDGGEDR